MFLSRFVNFRPLFVLALEVVAAIIGSFLLLMGNPYLYGFVLSFFAVCAVTTVIRYRRLNSYTVVFALGVLATIIFPIQIKTTLDNRYTFPEQENVSIIGVTSDTVYSKGSRHIVWLEKVTLNGEEVEGKLEVILTGTKQDLSRLSAGVRLEFTGAVQHKGAIEKDEVDTNSYKNNLRYYTMVDADEVAFYQDTPTFFSGLRQRIKDTLRSNLSADMAELSFAMLVGDVTNLSPEISSSFRGSGITHILSVSGLHVAFLVLALNYAFKLFGLESRRGIKLIITSGVLLVYIFLCGFAPTVIRAALMSVTYLITRFFFQRYDMLNSISITAIVVLIATPIMLFDIGFQLSFMAVFGMAAVKQWITMMLERTRLKRFTRLNAAIAMTVAAQLATIPLMMMYFQTLSVYSIISNLIIVPLSEVGYIGQMLTVPLAMLIPKLGFFVKITSLPYELMTTLSNKVAELPGALIVTMWIEGWVIIGLYLLLLLSSRYIILGFKQKLVVSNIFLICLIITLSVYNIPSKPEKMTATMSDIGLTQNVLFVTDDATILVTDLNYEQDTIRFFSKNRLNKVNYVYLTKSVDLVVLKEFCEKLSVEKVFVPIDDSFNFELYNYSKVQSIDFVSQQEFGGVTFTCYVLNYNYLGIRVEGSRSYFMPKSDAAYLNILFAEYFSECLTGDVLFGSPNNEYEYDVYFHKNYVNLVTNYSGSRINDCYSFAL